MARIKIVNHDRLEGDYRAITQSDMKLGTQMELQYQSGWANAEMKTRMEQAGSLTAVIIFATLWQAGMKPTWDEIVNLGSDQIRYVREASDPVEDEGGEADPTSAPQASPRGDDAAQPADVPSQP